MEQYFEFIERHLGTLIAFHVSLFAVAILSSVAFRRARGKPVLGWTIDNAQYVEHFASGYSHRTWYTRLGGASRCLLVGIADGRLIIRPWFPFNLMFLPEIYGLEHDLPISHVEDINVKEGMFGRMVRLRLRAESGKSLDVSLYLRNPDRLIQYLEAGAT